MALKHNLQKRIDTVGENIKQDMIELERIILELRRGNKEAKIKAAELTASYKELVIMLSDVFNKDVRIRI